MARRLSYPLLVALGLGLLLQAALAFAPDPGLGPQASGLAELQPGPISVASLFVHNVVVVVLVALGAMLTGWLVLGGDPRWPRRRMLAYLGLLAVAEWAYFVSGVGRWPRISTYRGRP